VTTVSNFPRKSHRIFFFVNYLIEVTFLVVPELPLASTLWTVVNILLGAFALFGVVDCIHIHFSSSGRPPVGGFDLVYPSGKA
jgi:hypothetical protein